MVETWNWNLTSFGSSRLEQHVVGPLAVDRRELEVFIVKSLLDAGLGRLLAHFVVFVGRSLHVIHGRFLGPVEAGHQHLREADIFRPGNGALLIFSEFLDAEVRADASDTGIAQNFAELGSFVFGEACEARIGVAYRRAEFDGLKSGVGKLL